ncbi:MAG: ABC transporter ATP-binding protein/permease [Agathobacter sp.]|nr:ABC transporter ATP-binding protein/permease [Agathobacter sp.]
MFHKRLLKEFKDNMKYVIGMVLTQWVSLIANVGMMLTTAVFVADMVHATMMSVQSEGMTGRYMDTNRMLTLFIAFAITFLVRMIATTINTKQSFAASEHVKERLRELVYNKLMKLGSNYRETVTTAEAVQISTEGVDQLEIYFGKYVPQFFYSLLAPVTLFVVVGTMSFKVAIVLLLCVPLIPISIIAVQKFAKKLLAKYWGSYTGLGDTFLENLQGLTTLKIYQADERYAQKMDEEAENFRKITMRVLIMQLNSISIMDMVAFGGAAVGIILSILELEAGNITLAECFFITMISAEFFLPLRLLGSFFHIAMNGNAAADKIFRLLDAPEREDGAITEIPGEDILFEHVGFGYTAEKQVLKDVCFSIPSHSFVALVGESGCGKSTIASLLMGDMKADTGRISIGGENVNEIAHTALYKKISRVRHDSYLFKGTVFDNLLMGISKESLEKKYHVVEHADLQTNCEKLREDMYDALRQVDLYDTIMEKGGLEMPIEEKASNLSGGQKQRLALARAILHDSDIYIFDEATSNIDVESEDKIMQIVQNLAKEKLVILISHRLANVVKADHIFVVEKGEIVEAGSHEHLLAKKGTYCNLYMAQQELEKYRKLDVQERVKNTKKGKETSNEF